MREKQRYPPHVSFPSSEGPERAEGNTTGDANTSAGVSMGAELTLA